MLLGAYELMRSRGATWLQERRAPRSSLRYAVSPRRTARSRPPATTTSSSSTRRSPAGSRSGSWAEPEVKTIAFYALAAIAVVVGLARSTPTDGLRRRRARAHIRRWPDRNPRDRLVRARVHGLRSRRDRPQAREQEAGRAATRAERRDRHRAHRRAPGRRRLALRARRVVVRGVLAAGGSRSRPARARPTTTVSSHPTASRTGCSSRSRSSAGAWHTTCASSSTTPTSTIGSRTTPSRTAPTGSRSPTGTGSSSSTRRGDRTPHDFLAEPGARVVYRDDELTVIARQRG